MKLETLLDLSALAPFCPPRGRHELDRWTAAGRRLSERGHGEAAEVGAFFVPGRVEVVGKHTDYAGGRSLVGATEQGIYLAVAPRRDRALHLDDLGRGEDETLDLSGDLDPPAGQWTAYPAAVARRLRRDFGLDLSGADVAFSSSLPTAAGMSSSSALVVAAWLALARVNRPEASPTWHAELDRPEGLAAYLAAVEAGRPWPTLGSASPADDEAGVGTRGGSEDHTAILASEADRLGLYSYLPTRREATVELPAELTFAVAVSGVVAAKTGAARAPYNRAADLAAELAERWREDCGEAAPHLAAIVARGREARERLLRLAERGSGRFEAADLVRRLEQFVAESEAIVPAAAEALAAGRLGAFGRLVDRSQASAERLLGNQTPETVHLASSARRLGAHAASAFGAGFGGAVWALVPQAEAAAFDAAWRADYLGAFPPRASGFSTLLTRPGPGAFELGHPADEAPTARSRL